MSRVSVEASGEFFVRDGKVYPILESEMMDRVEDAVSYTVWVPLNDDGEPLQCGW